MSHSYKTAPAGIDSVVHRQMRLDYWTPFMGTWYRYNCACEMTHACIGCNATGGLIFAFHDGLKGTQYSSTPPYGHLYCFGKLHGLIETKPETTNE